MAEGWVCPTCAKVNAPWVAACDHVAVAHSQWVSTTAPECEHEWFSDTAGTRCAKCGKRSHPQWGVFS
jgi:uncharacterized OB-fold protein